MGARYSESEQLRVFGRKMPGVAKATSAPLVIECEDMSAAWERMRDRIGQQAAREAHSLREGV